MTRAWTRHAPPPGWGNDISFWYCRDLQELVLAEMLTVKDSWSSTVIPRFFSIPARNTTSSQWWWRGHGQEIPSLEGGSAIHAETPVAASVSDWGKDIIRWVLSAYISVVWKVHNRAKLLCVKRDCSSEATRFRHGPWVRIWAGRESENPTSWRVERRICGAERSRRMTMEEREATLAVWSSSLMARRAV